jgi:hypothetical protein
LNIFTPKRSYGGSNQEAVSSYRKGKRWRERKQSENSREKRNPYSDGTLGEAWAHRTLPTALALVKSTRFVKGRTAHPLLYNHLSTYTAKALPKHWKLGNPRPQSRSWILFQGA